MSYASVLIARYLVATGRRDAAIAELRDQPEPLYAPEKLLVELDVLDAVDALGELARRPEAVRWYDVRPLARALARRRRFDLLRPLLEREHAEPWHANATISAAVAGLWTAPAVPDDSVLVRDWLLPVAVDAYARSQCAQLLAVLGDVAMAGAIADEQRAAIAATSDAYRRAELLAAAAPAVAALGAHDGAAALLREANALWDEVFDEDIDGYGANLRDSINYAQAQVAHIKTLSHDRTLPWHPQSPVASTFTGFMAYSRFGPNREQHEAWRHAVDYRIEARDIPAVFAIFEHARTTELDHAPLVLAHIASDLPRAWIDRDVAIRLSAATCALTDPERQDGGAAVIAALAEAGHLDAARALVPHVDTIYTRPGFYARLGAHLVPHDPKAARALVEKALGAYGDEQQLADFVIAELTAGR